MLTIIERNDLILKHLSKAEEIAASQFKKTPFCVQFDELKSAAYMGLVDAAKKYKGTKPFDIYASFRIYGEIKDYLRSLAWGSRKNRLKSQAIEVEEIPENQKTDCFEEFFEDITKDISSIGKKLLYLYYVEDMTMKEIGKSVSLSSTRVYQIIQECLSQIRKDNLCFNV